MKTKFYFLVISLLAICSVCLPACDNDEKGDVTKPVIDLIEPEEGAVLKIGSFLSRVVLYPLSFSVSSTSIL